MFKLSYCSIFQQYILQLTAQMFLKFSNPDLPWPWRLLWLKSYNFRCHIMGSDKFAISSGEKCHSFRNCKHIGINLVSQKKLGRSVNKILHFLPERSHARINACTLWGIPLPLNSSWSKQRQAATASLHLPQTRWGGQIGQGPLGIFPWLLILG